MPCITPFGHLWHATLFEQCLQLHTDRGASSSARVFGPVERFAFLLRSCGTGNSQAVRLCLSDPGSCRKNARCNAWFWCGEVEGSCWDRQSRSSVAAQSCQLLHMNQAPGPVPTEDDAGQPFSTWSVGYQGDTGGHFSSFACWHAPLYTQPVQAWPVYILACERSVQAIRVTHAFWICWAR